MGRPSKLTPETKPGDVGRPSEFNQAGWQKLLQVIASGVKSEARALAMVRKDLDIEPCTLTIWKRDYSSLSSDIARAHHERRARLELLASKRAQGGVGNMLKFLLQTDMPEDYTPLDRHELGGIPEEQGGRPIQFVVADIDLQVVTDADSDEGQAENGAAGA